MRLTALFLTAALAAGLLGGCARAARDTTGFAVTRQETVQAPFEVTWQAVKHLLRENNYELYTRDKRGLFVAYTEQKGKYTQPRRVKYTIELSPVTSAETAVSVEAVRQVYGVTLLTYPGWHDRKMSDEAAPAALIDQLRAKLSGAPEGTEITEAAAEADPS